MKLIEFIFSNFWIWLGFIIILTTILKSMLYLYSRTLRFFILRKHGYPANCDADGDSVYCKNKNIRDNDEC
jgi:hypothetical protein